MVVYVDPLGIMIAAVLMLPRLRLTVPIMPMVALAPSLVALLLDIACKNHVGQVEEKASYPERATSSAV